MQNDQYKRFLRDTRDTVAGWIDDDPKIKALFADDLNDQEEVLKKYNADDKKFRKWFDTPVGRRYKRRLAQWDKKHDTKIQKQVDFMFNAPWSRKQTFSGDMPVPDVTPPDWPFSDLMMGSIASGSLSIERYRFLLAVLHDRFTLEKKDKTNYICPHLLKAGTVVRLPYWQHMMENPDWQPIIEEARRYVAKDLKDRGLIGNQRQTDLAIEERTTNKRGRSPLTATEAAKRQNILGEWKDASNADISRIDFCNDKDITIQDLEKYQAWKRKRAERDSIKLEQIKQIHTP